MTELTKERRDDAWKTRAEKAEARVKELEGALTRILNEDAYEIVRLSSETEAACRTALTPVERTDDASKNAAWAAAAAGSIVSRFGNNACAIETADYAECGFIIEAAKLALADQGVAARIGAEMEPERTDEEAGE